MLDIGHIMIASASDWVLDLGFLLNCIHIMMASASDWVLDLGFLLNCITKKLFHTLESSCRFIDMISWSSLLKIVLSFGSSFGTPLKLDAAWYFVEY